MSEFVEGGRDEKAAAAKGSYTRNLAEKKRTGGKRREGGMGDAKVARAAGGSGSGKKTKKGPKLN